jgi:hypothetical protein
MNVNATINASKPPSYDSASKTGKTGKHEAPAQAPSYAPKNKAENSIMPEDILDISDAVKDGDKAKENSEGKWKDFDMDAFQSSIRGTLMESIYKAKEALRAGGVEFAKYNSDSILYDLSGVKGGDSVKAADVPEYWNAENTSQRIVDFAMSFRSLAPELSDEEYIEQIRKAVEQGYKLAKRDVGDLPGPSAKLFNDTYSLTMQKFDKLVEQATKK